MYRISTFLKIIIFELYFDFIFIKEKLTIDSSVSAVGTSAHLGGSLHGDVIDDEVVHVQALVLRVALSVPAKDFLANS